jgi:hypothetical protein
MLTAITWYRSVASLKALCIPLLFLFDQLQQTWLKNRPERGWFNDVKMEIDFSPLQVVAMWTFLVLIIISCLLHLRFSYKPKKLPMRWLRRTVLISDGLTIPFLIYFAWENIDKVFFPYKNYGLLDHAISSIFPNNPPGIYEKLSAIVLAIFTLCTIFCFIRMIRLEMISSKQVTTAANN